MNNKLRKVMLVIFSVIFVVSACVLVYELLQYREGDTIYSEAESLVDLPPLPDMDIQQPEPSPTPEDPDVSAEDGEAEAAKPAYVDPYADALRNMDFTALQAVNDDVLGWIVIPGTKISYPVVQGSDNSYYLKHTWKKTSGAVGAIFMDARCSQDLSGFNTIIYGHRMNNGSMFAGLKYYKKQSYFTQHPTVYITTANGSYQYEIFSVYEGSPTGESYRVSFSNQDRKQAFLDAAVGASLYDTGVTPTVNDSILTLSTCTGNGHAKRLIVHALRKGYAASDEAAQSVETPETAPPVTPDAPSGAATVEPPPTDTAVNPADTTIPADTDAAASEETTP